MSHLTLRLGLRQCPGHNVLGNLMVIGPAILTTAGQGRASTVLSRHLSSITISKPSNLASSQKSNLLHTPSRSAKNTRHASTTHRAAQRIRTPSNSPPSLDWNSFFKLRTSRRRFSLISSVISAVGVTGGAFVFLSTQPEMADKVTQLIPMDPVISMGLLTFGATAIGWLIGPVFGNTLWKLVSRSRLPEFTIKERAFFERIKKHRVNPQGASTNNPVPDYYGEKIGSVKDYRRWLKDQRAFNRKKQGTYPGGI